MQDDPTSTEDLQGLTDLNLATFLGCRGVFPTDVQPQPYSGLCTFVYQPTDGFNEALEEWREGPPLLIDPSRFMQVRRGLLGAINEAKANGGEG